MHLESTPARRLARRIMLSAMLCLPFALPVCAQSQTGRIVGRILDGSRSAPVFGAVVELVGGASRIATNSSIDGRYTLSDVPSGEVSVRVRMIGFGPKMVSGIRVPAGGAVTQDIMLSAEAVQLEELSVTSEAERGSISKALNEQRNATGIVNGITAEQIAKSPDGDAGQAVQRISGVTVQDGKYVFVRGLGERYTTTSLNGARIPSLEPERKVVPLDLFPSSLLEGITTSKTFVPDQPGDMTGAEVNLKTREYPSRRVITFSVGTGLNTAATGPNVLKAPTTGREWLGFATTPRSLPDPVRAAGDLKTMTPEQEKGFVGSFRNAWSARSGSGSPNGSLGLSVGGEDPFFGQPLGYLASLSYSTGQELRKNEEKGLAATGGSTGTAVPFNTYFGSTARNSILWGGLLNLSTRIGSGTRISTSNTYSRSADNEASVLTGDNEEFGQTFQFTRLTYTERSVRSNQLAGEHLIGGRHLINWSASSSGVTRNEPDRSDIGYVVQPGGGGNAVPTEWFGQARFATRTFSKLTERGTDLSANYQLAFGPASRSTLIKVGGAWRSTTRTSDTRAYDIVNRSLTPAELAQSPERIFNGQYASEGRLLLRANAFGGGYDADDRVTAGFGMLDVPIGAHVRVIGGARLENWRLDVLTRTPQGDTVPALPRAHDLLPSLAINVAVGEDQNLRFSGSRTVSRPEYRELSPVPYFEQVGLLTTFGNPNLRRATIANADVRWEWFPTPGEVLSVSFFAKRFTNPIEKIIVLQAGAAALGFVNAKAANNYGVEFEFRKNMGLLDAALIPVTLFANTTLMKSQIKPGSDVLTSADRPMVGQSEYVVNAGLGYLSGSGRVNATVFYNVAGPRITEAGVSGLPDTYERARQMVDATLQIPLFATGSIKLDGRNLLDSPVTILQGGVTRHRYTTGRVFSVGFGWKP
jgi:hypothetical protein